MIDGPTAPLSFRNIAREARSELVRITDWWTHNSVDLQRGGFFGEIDAGGAPQLDADKAVVLNTRLLWFLSEAGMHLHAPACLDLAQRAADYLSEHFIDGRHGGLFWMLDARGCPLNRRKQAYAQAFGIYAFSAHYAATRDQVSLNQALALFDVLETRFWDKEGQGYWEALGEYFTAISDMRLSERDANASKTMNAHLHVLEAYTALYRIHRTPVVAAALERAIRVMTDRIFDSETGHLRLFFDARWCSTDQIISFGHDIEASWLLWEAADVLGVDDLRETARRCALRLAETTLTKAIGPNGEVFEHRNGDGFVSERRVWWIQAEALIGFLNAFDLTGDANFLDASVRAWRFIQRYQLDRDGGEWRASSKLDPPTDPPEARAGAWKCPYHTGRAMMEMERRALKLASAAATTSRLEARN